MEKIKCLMCKKRIEGFTEKQVEYLLKQHILAKHPELFSIDMKEKKSLSKNKPNKKKSDLRVSN